MPDTVVGLWTNQTLYDDEAVHEKLKVMDKWEVIFDDARNCMESNDQMLDQIEDFLELGCTYDIRIEVTKVRDKP